MKIPQTLNKYFGMKYDDDDALKLVHSIYELEEVARQFFKMLRDVLVEKLRFQGGKNNQLLRMRKDGDEILVICLYIYNTLVIGKQDAIERFKKKAKMYFRTKEEG